MDEHEPPLHTLILGVRHTTRFRRVSTRYPRRVDEAYSHDHAAALADTDEQVAARVADWEVEHGRQPCNWHAIGRYERGEIPASKLGPVERDVLGRRSEE